MESGDLNDLCPETLDSDVDIDLDTVDRSVDGFIANGMTENDDDIVLETNNVSYIPLNQCLMKTSFTVEERVLIRLGQACNDTNAPLYLVDEIMEIIQDECDNGIRFDKIHFRKRDSFMKHLFSRFNTPKANLLHIGIESLHPNNMEYRREFRDSVSVVYYDFLDQVNDLLNDISIWGDESNFEGTVDMKNPFSNDFIRSDEYVDEVNDGHWFCETNEECKHIAGDDPYLVLPVIGYIDKTGTDVNQRNKLEPFSFTLSILNRCCRYRTNAWRVLGFMPDLEHKSSAAITRGRSGPVGKGRMARNYHRCLAVILQSFMKQQGKDIPIYGTVRIGNFVARRRLFFPLAFVIGDGLSGDQLCGRYKNYSPNIARLSRTCNVSFHESDNPNWQCQFLKMEELQSVSIRALELHGFILNKEVDHLPINVKMYEMNQCMDKLQKLSQHMHDNAFDSVWFGVNPNGILGASPMDLMHAFLHGLIPYVVKIVIGSFTTREKHQMDILVDNILVPIRSGERSKFPRTNFARGVSNLKLLTANKWAGVAFAISLIIRCRKGYDMFQKVCNRNVRKQQSCEENDLPYVNDSDVEDNSSHSGNEIGNDNNECNAVENENGNVRNNVGLEANDVLYVLEMILSFHAWYKCGGPFKCGTMLGKKEIHNSIVKLLETVKMEIPRSVQNGWKLQKFHDMLHVSRDMYLFGNPQNWDASPGEHSLIDFAKRPARRTQKRHETFIMQVTQRLREANVLNRAYNLLAMQKKGCVLNIKSEPSNESCVLGKPYASVLHSTGSTSVVIPNKSCKHNVIHPVVVKWFDNEWKNQESNFHACSSVDIFSEYKTNETIYQAHQNFQSMGPWHDWVMVTFADDGEHDTDKEELEEKDETYFQDDEFPSKILCFFVVDKKPDIYAIVQSCIARDREQDSILFQHWEKEYIRSVHQTYAPVLHAVPVESFGERVLVVEDDSAVREAIDQKNIEPGCTLVLPREAHWAKQFLSID